MTDELNESRLTRRTALKRIGAGAAVVWAAPAVMSVARASAASPPPAAGCTGPGVLVAYNSGGWKYLETPNGGTTGFEAPSFVDSGWATGTAGFGSGGGCPIQSNAQTNWNVNTDMLLRRTVTVPNGATSVEVGVVIDNDLTVYWDGVVIGGGVHDGCPSYDDFVMAAPATPGNHVLAIRGLDRGGLTFLDARVTFECGTQP